MRRTSALISSVAVAWLFIGSAAWSAPAGQVQHVSGDVRLVPRTAAPVNARSGEPIEPGTAVQTGPRSRAILKFADGQLVAISSDSTFRLDDYKFDQSAPDKGIFAASFLRGAARFVTGLIGDRNRQGWRVDTPTATAGIRGTDFMLGLQQGLYASVKSGSITLTNSAGTFVVETGGTAAVTSATALGASIPASAMPAGLFTELEALSLTASGGSAVGAGGGVTVGTVTVPTIGVIGIGLGAAAIAAGGGGDNGAATTHVVPNH